MKKTILTLALVASTVAAMAQGRISIANDSTRLFELGSQVVSNDVAGPISGVVQPSGKTLVLALYAGTSASSLSLQTSYALTGANFLTAGRGATKALTLTGVPGGVPQQFEIILTDLGATLPATINSALYAKNADANSSDQVALASLVGASYYGSSGLFQFTPSTSAIAAPLLTSAGTTWPAGSMYINGPSVIVPEPTSMALAGLGAASLLMFRRRK